MQSPQQLRQNLFLHLAEPRFWLKLLQLTVEVCSFEGRPHGRSSAAYRWVWHFLKGLWWWAHADYIRIPLTRRTCRTGHQPGFSRPPSMAGRRAEGRCGIKGISRRHRCRTETLLAKHAAPASERRSAVCKAQSLSSALNHLIPAPHQRLPCVLDNLTFPRYQPLISSCRVYRTTSHSHGNSPTSAAAMCRGLRSLTHSRR